MFPLNAVAELPDAASIAKLNIERSSDGYGSIEITAAQPRFLRLAEIRDIPMGGSTIVAQAQIWTEGFGNGSVYLKLSPVLPGRQLTDKAGHPGIIGGRARWNRTRVDQHYTKELAPSRVVVSIGLNGRGTAWVDDLRIYQVAD